MFPTAAGSSSQTAQETATAAAHQSHQGLDLFSIQFTLPPNLVLSIIHRPLHFYKELHVKRQQHKENPTDQTSQSTRDDAHRRPSLMSNFFPPHLTYQQGSSRDDSSHLHVDTSGNFLGIKISPSPGAGTTLSDRESDEQSEKKATSDRLEMIEKDRKQADQQVEILTKRRERLKNLKKESEQEVKDVLNGEVDEREMSLFGSESSPRISGNHH